MEENMNSNQQKREEMIEIYVQKQENLKSKFPEILKAPPSVQQEYFALNTLIDSLKTSRREVWGKTVSSDGCEIDKFVAEKYEKALEKYNTLSAENEEYLSVEEEQETEKEQNTQKSGEIDDKSQDPKQTKTNEKIESYIRRQAIIKSKFPDILKAPASIQKEYYALNSMIDSLQTSRREIWGKTTSSDGYEIDKFVAEKYEEKLSEFKELNEENKQYISREDEENFKYPEIDFDALTQEVQEMQTNTDYRTLYRKVTELKSQPLPEATKARLSNLQKEMNQRAYNGLQKDEEKVPKIETLQTVNESKFAGIYEKAKGRIKEVFSRIKLMIKEKTQGKESHTQETEEEK